MPNPALEIPNLLFTYAQFIDAGEFARAAEMFTNASVEASGKFYRNGEGLEQLWTSWIKLYDGKPLTRHLITNPIILLGDDEQSASCISQWTVLQATPELPLQVIGTGRYDDAFELTADGWRFTYRKYAGIDLAGDLSAHLKRAV